MAASLTYPFTFRVEGITERQVALWRPPNFDDAFDETYVIEGEHPAESLEKLIREIEWGILDSYSEWTITFVPDVAEVVTS